MNLIPLFTDAANIARMRYQPAEHYRYSPAATAAVLIAIGTTNSAFFATLTGSGLSLLAFFILFTVARWLILSAAISRIVRYFGGSTLDFRGYTLASELLVLPSFITLYLPQAALPLWFWQMWTLWAQAAGFAAIGGQRASKILLGYLLYLLGTLLAAQVLFSLFAATGLIDIAQLQQQLQQMLDNLSTP